MLIEFKKKLVKIVIPETKWRSSLLIADAGEFDCCDGRKMEREGRGGEELNRITTFTSLLWV